MPDERTLESRAAKAEMPDGIKALFETAGQSGFKAAKQESDRSWRFIASKGENEAWLTVNEDGSKVDQLQIVDVKTEQVISGANGETIQRWVDLLAGAGVNAKEGLGAYVRIEPEKTNRPRLRGIGITFAKNEQGKFYPTSLSTIDVT